MLVVIMAWDCPVTRPLPVSRSDQIMRRSPPTRAPSLKPLHSRSYSRTRALISHLESFAIEEIVIPWLCGIVHYNVENWGK